MIKKIRYIIEKIIYKSTTYFRIIDRIHRLEKANAFISEKFKEVTDKSTAQRVIELAMGRGIKWFDYQGGSMEAQIEYFVDAQSILNNKTFVNEMNHYIADTVNYIARETEDFEQVDRARRVIVAIETIRDRLEQISDPRKNQESTDDLNSAI